MSTQLSQSQELRLQQRLMPLQVQFVRMLEMTPPEIELEVMRAVEEMPALEADVKTTAESDTAGEENEFTESAEELQMADYHEDDIPDYRLEAHNHSSDDKAVDIPVANDEPTLAESLEAQIDEFNLSDEQRLIADYIIGNLDSNGYLKRSLDNIAADIEITDFFAPSRDTMESVFKIIRSLDPAGVGAVDLRDCLLLQLNRLPESPETVMARQILEHHFDLFIRKHYQRLASILNIDTDRLAEIISVILRLDPKPGSSLAESRIAERSRRIVPEFSVESDGHRLTLSLLDNIPELSIAKSFAEDPVLSSDTSERSRREARLFVHAKRDEAASFIKTLNMRQQTLFNVMQAIVEIQKPFFLTGNESLLRPMILKDVAELTGYDLSVISRATASKYVATVAGTYPLKFFFNERPKTDDDTSYHQIAAALKQIIENEDKSSPLSDRTITELLEKQGLGVARRTVAKYREKLGYPVARLRKEL